MSICIFDGRYYSNVTITGLIIIENYCLSNCQEYAFNFGAAHVKQLRKTCYINNLLVASI